MRSYQGRHAARPSWNRDRAEVRRQAAARVANTYQGKHRDLADAAV